MKPRFLLLLAALLLATGLGAAERIPPAPTRYFNDYAGITSGGTADTLNRQLEQFERDTSSQLLVVIYPKMESDSSVEDYTVRVATAWKAGQAGRNNGAVLFAFMQEHQLYLQVGYGLEGAIPDATAKRIIEREIVPRFRAGDMNGGMSAAVNAMIAAAKGEYKGTGATKADERRNGSQSRGPGFGAMFVLFMVILFAAAKRRRSSALPYIIASTLIRPGGSRWNSGRPSGGGFFGGGGGGGFSGGGGSFGGGGAGGKW